MNNGVKLGVAGLGMMGERHVRVYDKMPVVELYALCDANADRAREMSEKYGTKCYTDVEEMLKDPELDAVDIVLPDRLHRDAILLAAKYGKHILVEKPMASTVEDAQIIADALKCYDKTFMIGQILRFDPRYSMAREAVQSGKLGTPVSVYARRNSHIIGPRHYNSATNLVPHVMVHDIDAVQWILGERIKTVYAKASDKIFHDKTIMSLMEDGDLPYSISGFFEEWKQGCREMNLDIQRERILFFRGVRDDIATVNTTRLCMVDATDADSMSGAACFSDSLPERTLMRYMEARNAMKILVFDIGGTSIKSAMFENGDLYDLRETATDAHLGGSHLMDTVKNLVWDYQSMYIIDRLGINTAGLLSEFQQGWKTMLNVLPWEKTISGQVLTDSERLVTRGDWIHLRLITC